MEVCVSEPFHNSGPYSHHLGIAPVNVCLRGEKNLFVFMCLCLIVTMVSSFAMADYLPFCSNIVFGDGYDTYQEDYTNTRE